MKKILILIGVLILAGAAYWFMGGNGSALLQRGNPQAPYWDGVPQSQNESDAEKFSGTLEEVNTGCFADAECYVVVDGKHVTVLMGSALDPTVVGIIAGVPTIGELEPKIGTEVEVYAQKKSDGTYTLYGSQDYYVKVK